MFDLTKALDYSFAPDGKLSGGNILFVGEVHNYSATYPDGKVEEFVVDEHYDALMTHFSELKAKDVEVVFVESPVFMNVYFDLYKRDEIEFEDVQNAMLAITADYENGLTRSNFIKEALDSGVSVKGVNVRASYEMVSNNIAVEKENSRTVERKAFVSMTDQLFEKYPEISSAHAREHEFIMELNKLGVNADAMSALLVKKHMQEFSPEANAVIIYGDGHRNGMLNGANGVFGILDEILEKSGFRVTDGYIANADTLKALSLADKSKCYSNDVADWVVAPEVHDGDYKTTSSKVDVAKVMDVSFVERGDLPCQNLKLAEEIVAPKHLNPLGEVDVQAVFAKFSGGDEVEPSDKLSTPENRSPVTSEHSENRFR